jgi:hypothetical protein
MEKLNKLIYGLVFFLLISGTLHADDIKDGFLGIAWGTHISDLTGFRKVSQKGDVSYYRTSQKTYNIFEVDDASVVFGFYRDKFFAAYIAVESIETFGRVKSHLTQKFGSPKTTLKTRSQQTILTWKHENTRIKLKLYEEEGKMKLAFYFRPIAAEANEAQREVFPSIPASSFSIDDRGRKEAVRERRLQQAIDVMGF